MPEADRISLCPIGDERNAPWVLALTLGEHGLHWTFETRQDLVDFALLTLQMIRDG